MTAQDNAPVADRTAPNSEEFERAVLGSLLINPDVLVEVARAIVGPKDFYTVRNQWIYEAILDVAARDGSFDSLTVIERLKCVLEAGTSRLELIGGSAHITHLINVTPTHVHAEIYAKMVARMAVRRRIMAAAGEIATIAMQESKEITQVIANSEQALKDATMSFRAGTLHTGGDVADELYDETLARYEAGGDAPGIPTGYGFVDSYLHAGGLARKELYVVAARPGMGKTSFLLKMAGNIARAGGVVGFFSMETSRQTLTRKLLSIESRIPVQVQERGALSDDSNHTWEHYNDGHTRFAAYSNRIIFDDNFRQTGAAIMDQARYMYQVYGVDVVFIDYLQKIQHGTDNVNYELGKISGDFVVLAGELNIPIVLAAQLSRKVEERADKTPMMSDLRDSGEIEQDAHNIMFLSRASADNDDRRLTFAKQRNGEAGGSCVLKFNAALTEFV